MTEEQDAEPQVVWRGDEKEDEDGTRTVVTGDDPDDDGEECAPDD